MKYNLKEALICYMFRHRGCHHQENFNHSNLGSAYLFFSVLSL